ncbi:MAG TPA: hypothetical protein VGD29_03515 [Actinoplanes sp.]
MSLGCNVAAPIVDVPFPIRTEPILVARPQVGAVWRRAVVRAVLVPLAVLSPIVALAPTADHRFNIYWHGGLFRDDPLRIVPDTVDSLPGYLRAGNFRPLGRMVEKLLDLAAYLLGDVFGIPANVAFRLVEMVCAVLLSLAVLLLAESVLSTGAVFRRPPSTVAAVVPFAVGAGFVAAGRASPVVLFGGLYFTSSALVFVVAALISRVRPDHRTRWRWIVPLLLAGAALASFNEIAYFALPLATVAAAGRGRYVLGVPWRRLAKGASAKLLALLWLGFLPVFVAVRVVIARDCAAGACYRGSDVHVSGAIATALPERMVAWLPPLMWQTAVHGGSRRPWFTGVVLLLALVVLAALARHAMRDLPRLSPVDRRAAGALTAIALALLVLGAALGALNADVQQIVAAHRWGQGWRDTASTAPAGALLIAAAAHLMSPKRWLLTGLIGVLAVGGTLSAAANKRFRDTVMNTPAARLDDRLAQAMADFDPTPAGQARRCELRDEFFTMFRTTPFSLRRFDQAFDTAAEQRAGQPFCPSES